jgi:hypothetical protein
MRGTTRPGSNAELQTYEYHAYPASLGPGGCIARLFYFICFLILFLGVYLITSGSMAGYFGKPGDADAMHAEIHSSLDEEVHIASVLEKDEGNSSERTVVPKLDRHGLPLVPQPSNFKDDPLVRSPE